MTVKTLLSVFFFFAFSINLKAQHNGFEDKIFRSGNDSLPYRILYPAGYDSTQKYPLLLFLHGAGERGRDNQKQLVHGGNLFLHEKNRMDYPAIVVFPQCPPESYWSNVNIRTNPENKREFIFYKDKNPTKAMEMLLKLFKEIKEDEPVDKKRLYIGGLSMGAMGTFEMLYRCPKDFAAAFAICGGGSPETVDKYAKRVDTWIFHGAKDNVVPVDFSMQMADAIRKKGGDVKLTIYPEANHNSWDSAFAEPELLLWLFSKSK